MPQTGELCQWSRVFAQQRALVCDSLYKIPILLLNFKISCFYFIYDYPVIRLPGYPVTRYPSIRYLGFRPCPFAHIRTHSHTFVYTIATMLAECAFRFSNFKTRGTFHSSVPLFTSSDNEDVFF